MKCRYLPFFGKCGLILCLFVVYGCASQVKISALVHEWVARPLSELKQSMKEPDSYASKIKWKEATYPLANGNYVFVEPVGKDCNVHWEVHPNGMIVGYRAVGSGCEFEGGTSSGADIVNTMTQPTRDW